MNSVSVIIPAYNAQRTIGAALESVGQQSLRAFEVLVVDDGSTDATAEEAKRFSGALNLTVLGQGNAGPAAARNLGIRTAQGRYCAFLDADDVMLADRLQAQAALLDSDPALGLVHTDLMTFDEGGIVHRTRRAFSDPCGGEVLERLLLDNFITTSTVMAPREKLIEAGLFGVERRVSEDFELWLRMAARWPVGFVDRPLVKYRRSSGSLSGNKLVTARAALDVIESFWREHPEYARAHPRVHSRSVAEHLAMAGAAAMAQGQTGVALRYLIRALWHDPARPRSWKWVLKALIRPAVVASSTASTQSGGTA